MKVKETLGVIKTFKFWKELVVMTLGMLVGGAAVYYFMMPGNLVLGSMSGLSMVISQLFAKIGITIKVSVIVTILNIILLTMAWFMIGKEFGAKTIYTALILGPCLEFWERVLPYEKLLEAGQTSVMGDIWFDLICFVLLLSISQAILFNINASTGGLDILAKIVNKYLHFDIGKSVTVAGACICCTAFAINPFRLVVIGLIGTWINGIVVDYFTASLNKRKRVCLISDESEKIRKYIIDELHRGCSIYDVTGGWQGNHHIEIQTLLMQNEFADLMAYLKRNDIQAFVTAGNVSEIYGLWNDKHK